MLELVKTAIEPRDSSLKKKKRDDFRTKRKTFAYKKTKHLLS